MTLTPSQREAVEQAAAACFEKSDDIIRAMFVMRTYLEKELDRVATRDREVVARG